jgi:acyl-CoA synthetase (AMP-forming)/AMP-acid ligase II
MLGQMMRFPLTITQILRFAERYHGDTEIVSYLDGSMRRCRYRDVFARAAQIANGLSRWQLGSGTRIATLAWNDHRHLELYYGVSCAGHVLHTVNPRLFKDSLIYIINHAQDRVLFFDLDFLSLVESMAPALPCIEHYVALASEEAMPDSTLPGLLCYESWLERQATAHAWPELDEQAASALCYTSGTTGRPKGVLYSHRSTVLHAYASSLPDAFDLSRHTVVLPVVPMFHVNAWGVPYAALMTGARLVLPGSKMGCPETLQHLIDAEQVTLALGVPTVWTKLLAYLREAGLGISSLRRVIVGGSACPLALMQDFDRHGVETRHAWGMTELSPTGTVNASAADAAVDTAAGYAMRLKQGRPLFGIDLRVVDAEGTELPRDGRQAGELQVRGAWVCRQYFDGAGSQPAAPAADWFVTGDIATLDAAGTLTITDRSKDVIKSGGEWISSIELENTAMGHPAVAEAAVIGIAHPKWTERPLLVIVKAEGQDVSKDELLAYYEGKIARWWTPNDVVFVDELPHTATGKVKKIELRRQFAEYRFPE